MHILLTRRRPVPLRLFALVTTAAFAHLLFLPACSSLAEAAEQRIRYFHPDHLGSTALVTDENGHVIERIAYKPFGEVYRREVRDPTTGQLIVGNMAPSVSPYGFTGQRHDSDTGLYFYGSRYYDPQLGRFTQPDPFVQAPTDPQTLNRYSYVRNNPAKYVDPSGHFFQIIIPMIIAAIKLAAVGAAVGATVGGVVGGVSAAVTGQSITTGIIGGLVSGAASGATAFMGGAFASVMAPAFAASWLGQLTIISAAGAIGGGVNSSYYGGSFGAGALSGALWSAATFGVVKGVGASPIGQAIGRSSLGQAVGRGWGNLTRPISNTYGSLTRQLQTSVKGQPFQGRIIVGQPQEAGGPPPDGARVYRVWGRGQFGEGAGPWGPSWTTTDPRTMSDYRGAAGLFPGNKGRFLSEGVLTDTTGVTTKPATYGPSTPPGTTMVPEVVVPNAEQQVDVQNVSGLNPEF